MHLVALLLVPACTWVTGEQFDARLPEMDDDGDGRSEADGDCDDTDPDISDAEPETWYDGVDADCRGDDDFDQDADGFVADEHVGRATEGVSGTGLLPGGDCDDTLDGIGPEVLDTWYSGVDEDCDGVDDFDQDLDGWVPDAYLDTPTRYVEGSGLLPGGDCDDLVPGVHADAQDDWYDGIDTDCGGEDDYDADGDGWVPTGEAEAYGPTLYVDGSGTLEIGDCDDDDPDAWPGAPDTWYDDVDSDCAGDDDFDQDLDDHADAASGAGDDCDDLDPASFPGAVETLGDAVDADCSGDPDGFPLAAFDSYTWFGAHDPVFAANGADVYLSVVGTEVHNSGTDYYDVAAAARWSLADVTAGPDGLVLWSGASTTDPSYEIDAGQAFVVTDAYLYGVVQLALGAGRALVLHRYALSDGRRENYNSQTTGAYAPFTDVSLAVDDAGGLYAIGCEATDGVLHYVKVSDITSNSDDETEEEPDVYATDCSIDELNGWHVYAAAGGDLEVYDFDATVEDPTFSLQDVVRTYEITDIEVVDEVTARRVLVVDRNSGGVVLFDESFAPTSLFTGTSIVDAALREEADGTVHIVVADTAGDVFLAWGDPAVGLATVQLDVGFAADEVAVWATGGHVMVAAVNSTEVAWGVAAY